MAFALGIGSYYYFTRVDLVKDVHEILNDSFDWGFDKVVGNDTNALTIKGGHGKYADIDEILKMTEESEAKE